MLRIGFGILAGLVLAVLCVMAVEFVGHAVYPPPAWLDLSKSEDVARLMDVMPVEAKAIVLAGWFVAAGIGGFFANVIAQRAWPVWVVALFIVAGGVMTMMQIPHPVWMQVGGVGLPLIAAALVLLVSGRSGGAAAA